MCLITQGRYNMKSLTRFATAVVAMLAMSSLVHAGETEDLELATKVKTAIESNKTLKSFNLKVTGKNGDVTIDGVVDEGQQMAEVGMLAEQVPGVKYVFNNIVPKN